MHGWTEDRIPLGRVNCPSAKLHATLGIVVVMRVIAPIIVISVSFAIVLAHAHPILAKPTLFAIGLAHLADLMAEGCGPGWHWSNRRGWNWGRCVLDWRPIWERPASASREYRPF
jgi:hypothetical protein